MGTLTYLHAAAMLDGAPLAGVSPAAAWATLLGLLTPIVVSGLKDSRWSPNVRRFVSIGIAVVIGLGNLLVQNALDLSVINTATLLTSIGLVIGASQTAYSLLWKPTGVVDKVEKATDYAGRHRAGGDDEDDEYTERVA